MRVPLLALTLIYLSASTLAAPDPPPSTTPDKSSSSASPTESTPQPSSTTTPPSPSTTTLSSTSSSTPKTSTEVPTTPSPKTSTEPPTTPSTPAPTTAKPTVETTTHPDTTTHLDTTTQSPTPTEPPKPTPIPVPEPGSWNVTEGNFTCIRVSLTALFKIDMEGTVNYIALDPTASSDGSKCNGPNNTQILLLKGLGYHLVLLFAKESDNVYVKYTTFTYYLPGTSETFSNDTHLFEAKSGNSYLCKTESNVLLGNVTMEIKSIQVQAFGAENNKGFGLAEECGADNPINDIVPIAVGVALLALVVVVLIAYLVGRRRSRQKGYQSV